MKLTVGKYTFDYPKRQKEVEDWNSGVADALGLHTVPELYRGIWDEEKMISIADNLDTDKEEGFVVRVTDGFSYGAFRKSIRVK